MRKEAAGQQRIRHRDNRMFLQLVASAMSEVHKADLLAESGARVLLLRKSRLSRGLAQKGAHMDAWKCRSIQTEQGAYICGGIKAAL